MKRIRIYLELVAVTLAFLFALSTVAIATVTTTTFSNTYTASGSTTAFTFNFPVVNSATVVVELNGTVQSSGYTVTLNQTTPGGVVTFNTAPVLNSTVLITRLTPLTQTTSLTNEGPLPAASIMSMSDKLTLIAQEIDAMVSQVGGGTVTSVGEVGDNVLYNSVVAGSPITVSGSLVPALKAQNANSVFCNSTNSTAVPGWLQGLTNGTFLGMQGGTLGFFSPASGSGSVTSVAAQGDGTLFNSTVTGSPITTSGILKQVLATQAANTVFGNLSAGSAVPSFAQATTNGTFLGMQGGILGFFTPPSVSGGTVSNVSTVSTPAWLTSTWATSTTTPAQTIASATGLTQNTFLATPDGSSGTITNRAIVSDDVPPINLASTAQGGVVNTLPIANGGTNNGSLAVAAGGFYYGNGTQITQLGSGTGLLYGNGTSTPTYVTHPLRFVSTPTTWASSTAFTPQAHGLGLTPKHVWATVVCATANGGWSVGDELSMAAVNQGAGSGVIVWADGTNVYAITGSSTTLMNKSTGGSIALVNADWKLEIYAEP